MLFACTLSGVITGGEGDDPQGVHTAKVRRLLMAAFAGVRGTNPFTCQWELRDTDPEDKTQDEEDPQARQKLMEDDVAGRSQEMQQLWRQLVRLFFSRGKIKENGARERLPPEAMAVLFLSLDRVSLTCRPATCATALLPVFKVCARA